MAYTYYNQPHLFPPNPYPHPPPPPIAHKAVLLLRPNVSLFSSDALPVNCSAYAANPEALRCRSPCRPTSSNVPPRTCECLTQTLCCHGCGNAIGYMIVIPCTRCTSSISATNRATNGHRFVFHSSEVVGLERHYVQDEPGVTPYEPTESIPTPTLEPANPLVVAVPSVTSSDLSSPPFYSYPRPSQDSRTSNRRSSATSSTLTHLSSFDSSPPPLVSATFSSGGAPPEQKDLPTSRALKPGDVLFWHHLTRCGEIPGVEDDKRARSKAGARGNKNMSCVDGNNLERRGRSLGRVVFGR
ncbi:Protein FAM72A [Leucoagaricus sp. SymC.cos]|nr:Protein FAM72A [Leucoagaricus sp. SymC.cos]